ncbi:MAG: dynamin family protein [Burkholderiaceae bacterium]|jgi:hypothetical protein|nr:dynamin family protein [Burkholderiaceae bacterium]
MTANVAVGGIELTAGFGVQFGRHDAWRHDRVARLKALIDWLTERGLADAGARERGLRLLEQIKSDKVMVAFVAEFSRGKSELINAMFFAGYGRRIMPANAGRTTMCPIELGYDAAVPPCLRLLPIETCLQPQTLMEWRMAPEKWTHVDLDVGDCEQLVAAMEKVSEVLSVSEERARQLGFWHDDRPEDNPPVDVNGQVEVPRWRHALINMAHPLLRQGLVVLDTPGLNAIGAELELTINLIAQAHAVVFILGADTGVTRSDLEVWRQHLACLENGNGTRLVALNKIDVLWDELSTPARVEAQIQRQCQEVARMLGLTSDQVVAVSAQKGLLAKVRGDARLLQESRLLLFEDLLARKVLGSRHEMFENALAVGVAALHAGALKIIDTRRRELTEQALELRGLHGKNGATIRQMNARIKREKSGFDSSATRMLEMRSAHIKLLRELYKQLGLASIKGALLGLADALRGSGVKLGIKRAYTQGFDNLRTVLRRAQDLENETQEALVVAFRQINAEYGFALQVAPAPDMGSFIDDLGAVERSHLLYLGIYKRLQLTRPEFCERLMRALFSRVRSIFETALGELELWDKTIFSQLDTQLRERRKTYERRFDIIERIQSATGSLGARLSEIGDQRRELDETQAYLAEAVDELRAIPAAPTTVSLDLELPLDLELDLPVNDRAQAVEA